MQRSAIYSTQHPKTISAEIKDYDLFPEFFIQNAGERSWILFSGHYVERKIS
jgi:hypothetical protein